MPRKVDLNSISESDVNKVLSETPDLKTERMTIRVTPSTMTTLKEYAQRRGLSLSSLLNVILSDWMEKNI